MEQSNLGKASNMVQKWLEEEIDANEVEDSIEMEEPMKSLSKSVEQLNVQVDSQRRSSEEMKNLSKDLMTKIV